MAEVILLLRIVPDILYFINFLSKLVQEKSFFDQSLTKCYLRPKKLSPSYHCLIHYCRGDTLTLSYRFYACVKSDLTNEYRNFRVLTNF